MFTQDQNIINESNNKHLNTVFDLITALALITAPLTFFTLFSLIITDLTIFVLTFYFIFTYYCPLDDLLALVVENKFT